MSRTIDGSQSGEKERLRDARRRNSLSLGVDICGVNPFLAESPLGAGVRRGIRCCSSSLFRRSIPESSLLNLCVERANRRYRLSISLHLAHVHSICGNISDCRPADAPATALRGDRPLTDTCTSLISTLVVARCARRRDSKAF